MTEFPCLRKVMLNWIDMVRYRIISIKKIRKLTNTYNKGKNTFPNKTFMGFVRGKYLMYILRNGKFFLQLKKINK